MTSSSRAALGALFLATAAAATPPGDSLRRERSARALSAALSTAALPRPESLAVRSAVAGADGRTVVRFDHTFQGRRVWGSTAVANVDAQGGVRVLTSALLQAVAPAGEPKLTGAQAAAIAMRDSALKGSHPEPRVELVVFPTAHTEGIKLTVDPRTGVLSQDRVYSVRTRKPSEPYVWAYAVRVFAHNFQDGLREVEYMIDAGTGSILRKSNQLKTEAAAVPARGVGHSQYSGNVTLDTAQDPDGTYALRDLTRGAAPNPFFASYYGVEMIANRTWGEAHHPEDEFSFYEDFQYLGNPVNTWGDGMQFQDWPHERDVTGQTAAVDAHYAMTVTWDMYENVFGRTGIDGQDTASFSEVHIRDFTGSNWDNAYWSDFTFGMYYGDGTWAGDSIWGYAPNPYGMKSLTELDIGAHEMTHGVTGTSAQLDYAGEPGGLNESTSDIMGQMALAYVTRRAGGDTKIPATGATWTMGALGRPAGPLRWMKKPSKDLISADNWYEGLGWLDVHFSSGPANRAFYYLSQGAPSKGGAEEYSPYLPGGMKGIGNDAAARIWFKALTEYFTTFTDYAGAREGCISAATDLFGAGSPQVAAVMNAFAAVNVGEAPGQPPRTRVTFPVISSPPMGEPGGWQSREQVVPMNETVQLHATVLNNSDQRVGWRVGGSIGDINAPVWSADQFGVGVVNADGTWTSPMRMGWFIITAYSKADPLQYAEGLVQVVNLDADADNEQDAVDMGATALSWWMPFALSPTHSVYGNGFVDDFDVYFFNAAIQTAWGKK